MEWHVVAGEHPTFRPGRTALLMAGEKRLGYFGELHPTVIETFDIYRVSTRQAVLAAELDLDAILALVPASLRVEPLPTFPGVHEDLALIVDRGVPAAELTAVIRDAGRPLLKRVELFDLYEGEQVPAGKKSLAYHLTFMSSNKTLRDRDVHRSRDRILQEAQRRLGARLRE
jgi:phenylalanyl-tRNA synthetase beta chain